MNSKQANILLQKPTQHDYETQFIVQSKKSRSRSPKRHQRSAQVSSRAVQQKLGGEPVLDVLCISFAQRIANDHLLSEIYGDLNTRTLMQVQRDLLLLALDDGFNELTSRRTKNKSVYSQEILQRHVKLGLMEREEYFHRMSHHLAHVLKDGDSQIISDPDAVSRTQRRFEATRPLLKITQAHLDLRRSRMVSIRFPILGHFIGKMKKRLTSA